jgi:hypothetical protein
MTISLVAGWMEMEREGRKYFFNTESQVRQWRCPRPVVPSAQRKVEVVHAPGYLSGTNTTHFPFYLQSVLFTHLHIQNLGVRTSKRSQEYVRVILL